MRELTVSIEICGEQRVVGSIVGNTYIDARFSYEKEYLDSKYAAPISISLPLQTEEFSAEQTRCFFEGLLPEGFSRKSVAEWVKADESDYLSILAVLGNECLGAIKVSERGLPARESRYERLTMGQVKALAQEGATKSTQILMETHLSLTGATGKVGLYYDREKDDWYLPIGDAPSTHIVKQSHVRLSHIVVNEQLCMLTARELGLDVPETFVINTGTGADEDILYATARYDRVMSTEKYLGGLKVPNRLHQEDFAQALGIASSDKYEKENRGYLKSMFNLIRYHCSDPITSINMMWKSLCFHYLVGNTDCHIKNYSFLYSDDLKGVFLAPIYDIVSTRVYQLTKEMSLYIGGEVQIDHINRTSFAKEADEIGMSQALALKMFDEIADGFESAINQAAEELTEKGFASANELKDSILQKGGYAML